MATTIHYPSESSTIDALWTILSQQTENVKRTLATRLMDSFSMRERVCPNRKVMKDEELASVLAEYPSFDNCRSGKSHARWKYIGTSCLNHIS